MIYCVCDKCNAKIEYLNAHCKVQISISGAIDEVKSTTLDLCRKCEKEFIAYAKLRIVDDS